MAVLQMTIKISKVWRLPGQEQWEVTVEHVQFGAFPASEYDDVFSGYQPGQPIDPADSPRKLHHATPLSYHGS